jgi:hypothetical protein
VSEQTIEVPPLQGPPLARPAEGSAPRPSARDRLRVPLELIRSHPWISGGILLLAISTVIVRWAAVRPGYDPYGWLVWGHLTIHFNLNTNGAPSWKPLPFVFDVPFAVIGHYALWLWMITSVAISLSGVVFAWRIAFRLADAPPQRRYASYVAGLFAACAVLGIRDYTHFTLSAQSDPMIVSLCLAAIDCQLSGRRRWAFWMWLLGSLGRPEVWPFLGVYSLWAWRTMPELRRMIAAGLALIPVFWFGIPALTAKSPFVAGNIALHSPRELHNNKFFGTIDRFFDLHELPVQLAALLAVVLAVLRRQRTLLILSAGAVLWVLLEAAFALHGWPAVPRYLFEPVAVMGVLAGVAIGRVVLELPPLLSRITPRITPQLAGAATALVVVAVGLAMVPPARSRLRIERRDLTHERARAQELNRLSRVVTRLGATRILACGQPNIPIGYQSVLAWYLGSNVGELYFAPNSQAFKLHPHPVVNLYPLTRGWKVFPSHVANAATAAQRAACSGLRLTLRS